MASPARFLPVAQEARTEIISPDAPAVEIDELRLFGLDWTAIFADETSKLTAVPARSGDGPTGS